MRTPASTGAGGEGVLCEESMAEDREFGELRQRCVLLGKHGPW